jgi:hypothetical protein
MTMTISRKKKSEVGRYLIDKKNQIHASAFETKISRNKNKFLSNMRQTFLRKNLIKSFCPYFGNKSIIMFLLH